MTTSDNPTSFKPGFVALRALSLWQPWATLVAIGQKRIETRGWSTSYRGPLLICSTAKTPGDVFGKTTTDPRFYERVKGSPIGYQHGVALCVVELKDCERAEDWIDREEDAGNPENVRRESVLGDLSAGRFAWRLSAPRPLWRKNAHGFLMSLIDVKGRQGLWTVSPELLAKVNEALSLRAMAVELERYEREDLAKFKTPITSETLRREAP